MLRCVLLRPTRTELPVLENLELCIDTEWQVLKTILSSVLLMYVLHGVAITGKPMLSFALFVLHGVASIGKPMLSYVLLSPTRSCKYWKTYVELCIVKSYTELQVLGNLWSAVCIDTSCDLHAVRHMEDTHCIITCHCICHRSVFHCLLLFRIEEEEEEEEEIINDKCVINT